MSNVHSWSMKGWTLVKLGRYAEAAQCYYKSRYNVLDTFLGLVNSNIEKDIEERKRFAPYLKILLQNDDFFISETKQIKVNDINPYMDIYIRAMGIVSLLYVNFMNEEFVAHYTNNKDVTIENLLIKNSSLWLSLITKSNDPKEGQSLLDYFYKGKNISTEKKESIEKDFGVFANCFTFNHDHLNQFRLYGKGFNGTEAGGMSIVLNQHFFSTIKPEIATSAIEYKRKIDAGLSIDKSNKDFKHIAYETKNSSKLPLFRCIYIDPETGFVASIGQREEYTFYQTKDEIDKISIYQRKINSTLKEVREELKELKNRIRNLDPEIVSRLLLALRYLTKDVSFKEEQECRIFKVALNDQSHIEYIGMKEYIDKIIMGTNMNNKEKFISDMNNTGIEKIELSKRLFVVRK